MVKMEGKCLLMCNVLTCSMLVMTCTNHDHLCEMVPEVI